MASDAFFPFADGLLAAAEAGATAVIQPGGSMRDDEVIEAADEPASPWCSPACATSAIEVSLDPLEQEKLALRIARRAPGRGRGAWTAGG